MLFFFFIGSVRKNASTAGATRSDVEGTVKAWLRYAQDRLGGRRSRKNGDKRKPEDINGNSSKIQKKTISSDDSDS